MPFCIFVVNIFTMFCPKCGSNQGEGRKFCTSCGTNLLLIAQALSGRLPQTFPPSPPVPLVPMRDRQRELTKGLYFAIIGGGIMVGRLITFMLTGFRDGPFGFWGFIGFVLLAIGAAKIISYRAHTPAPAAIPPSSPLDSDFQQTTPQVVFPAQAIPPQPVFSATSGDGYETPRTSELEPVELPRPSVTEAETQTLPSKAQPPEFQE